MTQTSSARLAAAFAAREAGTSLIPYFMAGDPSPAATVPVMHALVAAGADVIELGVPFSDPMADGPVIQAAAERALAHGVSLDGVLDMVREFRRQDTRTPVVLMGYANPIERMGPARFVAAAAEAGVDGVLTVDYPPQEVAEFSRLLAEHAMDPIFLLAPTSTDARIATVAEVARGYVYYVSLKGVTGAGHLDVADVARNVERIRRHVSLPVGVGFGISDAASATAVAEVADAVVIGSRLVDTVAKAVQGVAAEAQPEVAAQAAGNWLRDIRAALDARAGNVVA